MTGCNVNPQQVFRVMRADPDREFTLDELMAALAIDAAIPDNRHAVIWCTSRLLDTGKINAALRNGVFKHWFPAPIEVDAITGRKFRWTKDGRRWVDEEAA